MKEYTYDGKKWYDLQPGQDVPMMASVVRQKMDAENGRNELEFMEWGRMTSSILVLIESVAMLQSVVTAQEETIAELTNRIDSLDRSFELYQEVAGIEIVAEPAARYWGVCVECERHGQIQESSGLCEGCTFDKQLPRL